jgi:UDP-N-acetylglucosamine 4-epimerase
MEDYKSKLYENAYHKENLSESSFLITGGAGFIGSNIVEYLIKFGAGKVRVLDNLSNGYYDNIKKFTGLSNFEFIEGDIRDINICNYAVDGIDFISHQAALGSVPRSIADPIITNEVNVTGFLNVLSSANESPKLKKFVYAASSSTYGDSKELPKIEGKEGKTLSPYAVTKAVNEMYADVFSRVHNFHTIGLRYFNVFGPNQNPNNPYAAVIPIFCKNFIFNQSPIIFGDGLTSRDFTFVENVVQANIKALFSEKLNNHEVFNVACGDQISLNDIIYFLNKLNNKMLLPIYKESRIGDVKHSKASIEKIEKILNYKPLYNFQDGLNIAYSWYENIFFKNNKE